MSVAVRRNHVVLAILAVLTTACGRGDDRRARPASVPTNDSIAVLVGAGDVADCGTDGAPRTARLLDSVPGTIFIAGDVAYRTTRDPHPLRTCFDPAWGRHLARIRPSPGNHEYTDGDAREYFAYFGDRAGAAPGGYYSYDLGRWHVIALNTNIAIDADSPEVAWLRGDLAAHVGRCTVAYMHHPRYSSGPHSGHELRRPIWDVLTSYGVSIAIAGHDHLYERFTPMNAAGVPDSAGVRQFVVGTGGARRYAVKALEPGSQAHSSDTFGLLELTLLPERYRWKFLPVDAGAFRDAGDAPCHPTHAER